MAYQSPLIKVAKYFPVIEGISLTAFVVGFILKALDNPSGVEMITIALSGLAAIYFLNGYIPPEAPKEPEDRDQVLGFAALLGRTITPKILSIGSSVSVIGILFTIQHWNGFREMLLIGSTSLAVASLVSLFALLSDEPARQALRHTLLRAIPLMLIGFYLLMIYGLSTPH